MTTITLFNIFRRIITMSGKARIEKIKENAEIAKKTIAELKHEVF